MATRRPPLPTFDEAQAAAEAVEETRQAGVY
jgi:hypothetical protein